MILVDHTGALSAKPQSQPEFLATRRDCSAFIQRTNEAYESAVRVGSGLKKTALTVAGVCAGLYAQAQTEANAIITQVESSFDLLVPVAVSIVTFFVVLRLAKRVVA